MLVEIEFVAVYMSTHPDLLWQIILPKDYLPSLES